MNVQKAMSCHVMPDLLYHIPEINFAGPALIAPSSSRVRMSRHLARPGTPTACNKRFSETLADATRPGTQREGCTRHTALLRASKQCPGRPPRGVPGPKERGTAGRAVDRAEVPQLAAPRATRAAGRFSYRSQRAGCAGRPVQHGVDLLNAHSRSGSTTARLHSFHAIDPGQRRGQRIRSLPQRLQAAARHGLSAADGPEVRAYPASAICGQQAGERCHIPGLTGGKNREEQLTLRIGHKTRPPVLSGLPGSMPNLSATGRDPCEYLPALMQEQDSTLRELRSRQGITLSTSADRSVRQD